MQTAHVNVTGMSCGGCVGKVTDSLRAMPGVADVQASLSSGDVKVRYDEHLSSTHQLIEAVKDAGYGVGMTSAGQAHPSKGCCCSSDAP